MANVKYEVIFCIVNAGFSSVVMDAARQSGAQGGTVIRARGTANKEAESYFNITIQPDKEIVMILVPASIKDGVLHAIYRNVGLNTAGQGIAFSVPANQVVGISDGTPAPHHKAHGEHAPVQAGEAPAQTDSAPVQTANGGNTDGANV